MASELDELQELIIADARKIYSETTIDHAMNPRNVGDMEDADVFARVTGPCGDTMEIWLKLKNGTIANATFMTDGCGTSIASGSIVTELAKGKSVNKARRISQQDVLSALGGLPEESEHCALLAANTLRAVTKDCLAMKREP
ncbi:MAG: iron-sulfur cluster assembly scaffold protein [Chloroflexi bacterium]|nr:iron-sulfur cluster assembly scaffold protein [Chloroflexota bacterium]